MFGYQKQKRTLPLKMHNTNLKNFTNFLSFFHCIGVQCQLWLLSISHQNVDHQFVNISDWNFPGYFHSRETGIKNLVPGIPGKSREKSTAQKAGYVSTKVYILHFKLQKQSSQSSCHAIFQQFCAILVMKLVQVINLIILKNEQIYQ